MNGRLTRICCIAYTCSPYHGTEAGIGFGLSRALANLADITVITREESRALIERYEDEVGLPDTMHFVYVDTPNISKLCFKGSLFSMNLAMWVRKAAKVSADIHAKHPFNVLHQITPVEFRALGLYDLSGCIVVAGPLGGGEFAPSAVVKYLKSEHMNETVRRIANALIPRTPYYKKAFRRRDAVLFANVETRNHLGHCGFNVDASIVQTEVGISVGMLRKPNNAASSKNPHHPIRLLFVGRLIARKGVACLLDACAVLHNRGIGYELRIVGSGKSMKALRSISDQLGLQCSVTFVGDVPHNELDAVYEWADLIVLPSVRETTGTVCMEAISHSRPVLAFDAFGARVVFDDTTAYLADIKGGSMSLANAIEDIALGRVRVAEEQISKLANSLTWDRRASFYMDMYKRLKSNG